MVAMLAAGSSAIFTSVALLTKHDHWMLREIEAEKLSEALNDALNTLPVKYYEQITGIIEKWIPWINLTFVLGTIVTTRIEDSIKLYEKGKRPGFAAERPPDGAREGSDEGHAPGAADTFNFPTSLGYDQR